MAGEGVRLQQGREARLRQGSWGQDYGRGGGEITARGGLRQESYGGEIAARGRLRQERGSRLWQGRRERPKVYA